MEIILLQDVHKLGSKHEVINVKNGYARNFLIPQGMAVIANAINTTKLETIIESAKQVEAEKITVFAEEAAKLEGKVLNVGVKAGTSGKIFGSVTSIQIWNALKDQLGIEVDRKAIEVPDDIKEMGTYTAKVYFHPKVKSTIDFKLVGE
jgi:large subunit ribosomal protein L9